MKKGLSILLVAAALFGFYGGATNLNDVLACKDYWEKAGEESTANMNKLEDGLNQLKENEQAYLDGKEQVAEGEKTLADGEAQYAQGLADYEAAPGKLADAEKQIAAGEAALADGKDAIDGLTKLISGIKQIRSGYNNDWRPGYEALKEGRNKIASGSKGSKKDLIDLAAFLDEKDQAAYVAAVNDVAGDDGKQSAKDYKDFIKSTNKLATDLPKIQKSVEEKYKGSVQLLTALKDAADSDLPNLTFAGIVNNQKDNLIAFAALISNDTLKNDYINAVEGLSRTYIELLTKTIPDGVAATIQKTITENVTAQMQSEEVKTKIAGLMGQGMSQEDAIAAVQKAVTEEVTKKVMAQKDIIADGVKKVADAELGENDTFKTAKAGVLSAMTQISDKLAEVNDSVNGDDSALKNDLLPGLEKFNALATEAAVDKLTKGQNTIAGGVATVASAVLGNSTLKAGVKKNFGNKALTLLKTYKSASGPLSASVSNFAAFERQMDKNPGVDGFLKKAQKLLAKTKADGIDTYNEGVKTLAEGKAQYEQGKADYAAAPGKLADAEKQLAEGRQQLADGKAQLAQYEDGEQQVRDGLATLTGTEADLDLQSIADRLGGDTDFDNGDDHLELDEGLAAVEIGRGYQAEDGALITKEIMARAVGTGALLAAGVLAVLAAILSFLKKNKGSGVLAILAAVAGAFGAFYGTQAGTYFSSIAGSTVGATGWVAAGILGAVALVHSIAHFTAKKEA